MAHRISSFFSGLLVGLFLVIVVVSISVYIYLGNDFLEKPLDSIGYDTLVVKGIALHQDKKNPIKVPIKEKETDFFSETSGQTDTISDNNSTNVDDVIVVQDKLLDVLKFNVSKIDQLSKNSKVDSLILTFENSPSAESESITIEFWKSPLNYNGFKLFKNRLVVYGLEPLSVKGIVNFKGKNFIKTDQHFYRIYPTDQFELLTIADEELKTK